MNIIAPDHIRKPTLKNIDDFTYSSCLVYKGRTIEVFFCETKDEMEMFISECKMDSYFHLRELYAEGKSIADIRDLFHSKLENFLELFQDYPHLFRSEKDYICKMWKIYICGLIWYLDGLKNDKFNGWRIFKEDDNITEKFTVN